MADAGIMSHWFHTDAKAGANGVDANSEADPVVEGATAGKYLVLRKEPSTDVVEALIHVGIHVVCHLL
jgi:hypothetical protein